MIGEPKDYAGWLNHGNEINWIGEKREADTKGYSTSFMIEGLPDKVISLNYELDRESIDSGIDQDTILGILNERRKAVVRFLGDSTKLIDIMGESCIEDAIRRGHLDKDYEVISFDVSQNIVDQLNAMYDRQN